KYTLAYREQVAQLAELINNIATYVPRRRKRKLHIGLFGYSRSVNGISLPRAITYTSSLYTLGIPPELLGLQALNAQDLGFLRQTYLNFDADLAEALRYTVLDSPFMPAGLREAIERLQIEFQPDEEHLQISRQVNLAVQKNHYRDMDEWILRAANLRQFLG
ncbi:MAG: phosphoenolpyruvate carboxylase, partial [Anaerolineaceae bacterium]